MSPDLQSALDYAKSTGYSFLSKTYSQGYALTEQHVAPTVRSLLSNHPDIASLALLLIIFYISLLVLNTASRWMYSIIMSVVRLLFMAALVLGVVWVVKVGRGEDAVQTVTDSVQWAVEKGREYAWNVAGQVFKR
jgi:hypothetical protein